MGLQLFVIRYAQTTQTKWKKFGFLSETDIDLNEAGIMQAKELGSKIKKYKIDIIFSSPKKRCINTAREIAKHQKKRCYNK
jgi:probable phosphoglycerate mutase